MFDLSAIQKMALHRETWEYNQYLQLLRAMGKQVTVDYNIEGLAQAQYEMRKARRVESLKTIKSKADELGEKTLDWSELINAANQGLDFNIYQEPLSAITGMHPVFLFAHHGRGFDGGRNQIVDIPVRGDVLSVPVISENGREIYYVTMAFHKGDFHVFFTYFPERPEEVREKLANFLDGYETR